MKQKVKICGITNLEDALNAVSLGADILGFIFVKSSPRFISPSSAKDIISKLPSEIGKVGVFTESNKEEIYKISETAKINFIQLHGSQSQEQMGDFTIPVIKAVRVSENFDVSTLRNFSPFAFLLDTHVKGKLGGTGKTFNWQYAVEAKKHGKIFLAGGLNPNNIIEAVETVQPYAVDVNSGVESSPGKKDRNKLELLFKNLKVLA